MHSCRIPPQCRSYHSLQLSQHPILLCLQVQSETTGQSQVHTLHHYSDEQIHPSRLWNGFEISIFCTVGGRTGRRETGRKGGGKRDSQGGGKWEKKGKIMQHCAIFCNRKNAKRREPTNMGWEPGLKGTGSGRFNHPCAPPPPVLCSSRKYPYPTTEGHWKFQGGGGLKGQNL